MLLFLTATQAHAQAGCSAGDVSYLGVNGVIKICSQYDAKFPELQKQLTQMQQTLAGNQALLREVTRAAFVPAQPDTVTDTSSVPCQ